MERWQFDNMIRRIGGCLIALAVSGPAAGGATFEQLFNGGFLEANGTRFTDWQLLDLDSTAVPVPDLSQIIVLPIVNDVSHPGLQFTAGGQLTTSGVNAIDLHFKYRAQVLNGGKSLTSHTSSMPSINFGGDGGIAFITDAMTTGLGADLGSTLSLVDHETEVIQVTSTTNVAPQSDVFVTTNVFLSGLAGADSISLSTFTHQFAQTGPDVLGGDYSQNAKVDAADYVTWRNNVGAPAGTLPNDTNGGVIGQGQYDVWQSKFGTLSGPALSAGNVATVPEPSAGILVSMLISNYWLYKRRRLTGLR